MLKPEQLDCDDLLATLLPAEKIEAARPQRPTAPRWPPRKPRRGLRRGAKDQAKIDDDDPADAAEGGGTFSNLSLHRPTPPGHAVWLQSESEGMKGFGNELIYDRFLPENPDQIYFRGDKSTEVVKTDFDAAGKPQTVNTIISKDFTVFQYGPGGPAPAVVANGPGTLEARAAGPGGRRAVRLVERQARHAVGRPAPRTA